ncbi:hypothetical protein FRACYDRAFT_231858 [Fragilariopsis cylindrus CCMP1102]|uniref:Uncharacterized protein n=1 Tax=Fragilariopsis cylindrus CCMP1102 TaxID=635003 RepID=A0A1E7FUA4_9STRA|nr:hypothetical protein FRACYDRAFT_231858 [Fragilariopsis cylindrus CCMP1102]|eukprot:OEU21714.1 hypothetical protein FRACYDRAFT_231858 [Fragilariopsis cylindrus CCMP1102]
MQTSKLTLAALGDPVTGVEMIRYVFKTFEVQTDLKEACSIEIQRNQTDPFKTKDKVTTEEILEESKDKKDPLEDYLPPHKIEDKDHIVQNTSVKFEDLKGMTTSDQTGAFSHKSGKGKRYDLSEAVISRFAYMTS